MDSFLEQTKGDTSPSVPSTTTPNPDDVIINVKNDISSPASPSATKTPKQASDIIVNENHEINRDGGISPASCFSKRIYFPNPQNGCQTTHCDTKHDAQYTSPSHNSAQDQAFFATPNSSSIKHEDDVSLDFGEDIVLSPTSSSSASHPRFPFHQQSDLPSVVPPYHSHQQRYHQERESQQQRQSNHHNQQIFNNENEQSIDDDTPCSQLEPGESTPERRQREEEESIALARLLMAEEAEASHRMSASLLQLNPDQFSQEDFQALQAALAEEEEVVLNEDDALEDEEDLSYEALLRLGERIGDVKAERWTMVARKQIDKLEVFKYDPNKPVEKNDDNDSEIKCLVCQFPYEQDDELRRLPCGHCFHVCCVDQWLMEKDICPYCRQTICKE